MWMHGNTFRSEFHFFIAWCKLRNVGGRAPWVTRADAGSLPTSYSPPMHCLGETAGEKTRARRLPCTRGSRRMSLGRKKRAAAPLDTLLPWLYHSTNTRSCQASIRKCESGGDGCGGLRSGVARAPPRIMRPLHEDSQLVPTIPEKPNSPLQRYVRTRT